MDGRMDVDAAVALELVTVSPLMLILLLPPSSPLLLLPPLLLQLGGTTMLLRSTSVTLLEPIDFATFM